jgi:hypothetical protein
MQNIREVLQTAAHKQPGTGSSSVNTSASFTEGILFSGIFWLIVTSGDHALSIMVD